MPHFEKQREEVVITGEMRFLQIGSRVLLRFPTADIACSYGSGMVVC